MNACLFPGQGSQEIGMGADLFRKDSTFRQWIHQASQWANTDLERICLRGPQRELRQAQVLQPLLVAVSLGYFQQLKEQGIQPGVVLGHSLGEISALAAAGVMDSAQAVEVAVHRGQLMRSQAAQLNGGMLALTMPDRDAALAALADLLQDQRVFLATDNAPTQCVLSGPNSELEEVARLLSRQHLASCRMLSVSGPWHCPLMAKAAQEFGQWLQSVPFRPPKIPVLMNGSMLPKQEPEQARIWLAQNLANPVLWRQSMDCLRSMRPTTLLEVGPGRVLSGLARANGFGQEVRIVPVNNKRGGALAAGAEGMPPGSR
jgi:[acyl-carrier-protein] S-malonyltransferase